jgi:hypothetical protein
VRATATDATGRAAAGVEVAVLQAGLRTSVLTQARDTIAVILDLP